MCYKYLNFKKILRKKNEFLNELFELWLCLKLCKERVVRGSIVLFNK